MAAGDLEVEVAGAADMQPDSPPPAKAAFGFTSAQQIMFQSSNMNGHRVVMVTPEVARSLGIAQSEDGAAAETLIQIQEDSGDVSVSVMDTEEDGMIDPDQFLAMELASGKAEAVVDEDLTSLSWLHSKNLLKASDVQFRAGAAAGEAGQAAAVAARRGPMSAAPLLVEESVVSEFSEESPTSDYLEEMPEAAPAASYAAAAPALSAVAAAAARSAAAAEEAERYDAQPAGGGGGPGGGGGWKFGNGRVKRHPPHLPYDPKVHVHFKPPFSFSCLIFMSIEDSPLKAMPVKDIYNWIQEHFPFYQAAPIGWKNSVRHNLSLNKCFCKIEKSPGPGKGSLWTVDQLFRPHLIQALKRSPCVQETPAGATSRTVYRPWTAAATALGGQLPAGSPRRQACRRPAVSPSSPDWDGLALPAPAPGPGGDPRSTESLEAAAVAAVPASAPPPRMTPRRRPGRGAKRSSAVGPARSQSDDSGPNPDLFPLLSRRLQSGSGDGASSPSGHQGVATGYDEAGDGEPQLMIVQEPPPPETPPARCRVKVLRRPLVAGGRPLVAGGRPLVAGGHDYGPAAPPRARSLASTYHHQPPSAVPASVRLNKRMVVIRRSPEEEHTYARDPLRRLTVTPHLPQLLSDDEAFSDDSNLSVHDPSGRTGGGGLSPEEAGIRFVQEGADLLLNLAGVPPSDIMAVRRAVGGPRRGRGRGRGRGAAAHHR